MDYERVYREFIADRRERESSLTGYTEKHHILPRCMGGGDEPGNLIRLTPEDHYFAHLVLAKIHGGKLWLSLVAMVNLTEGKRDLNRGALKRRFQFGHIRRALADYYRSVLSGPNSKVADHRRHVLRSFDGREAVGNRYELSDATGLTRQYISRLITGARMSVGEWYSPIFNPEGKTERQLKSEAKASPELFTLFHHDGRSWTGTRLQFEAVTGLQLHFQPGHSHIAGWYRDAKLAARHEERVRAKCLANSRKRGDISGLANPRADRRTYRWRHTVTGEERELTRVEFCKQNNARPHHVCNILNGRQKATRGWELLGTA